MAPGIGEHLQLAHRYGGWEAVPLRATSPDRDALGRVVDVGVDGLSVRLDGPAPPPRLVGLSYRGDHTPLNPVARVESAGSLLSVTFDRPNPSFLGKLGSYLADIHLQQRVDQLRLEWPARPLPPPPADGAQDAPWECIDDPTRVMLFCRAIAANHVLARVETFLGQDLGLAVLRRGRRKRDELVLEWDWGAGKPPVVPCFLYFEGHGAVYRLRVTDLSRGAGNAVTTRGPANVHRKQQRRFPRVAPPMHIEVRFEHPLMPGRRLAKRVSDVSYGGIGFSVDVAQDLLFHDLTIPELTVAIAGGHELPASGRVCHNFDRRVGDRVFCGLELTIQPRAHRQRWQGVVEQIILPNVQRADWPALCRIWSHYAASGYFSLSGKTEKDFAAFEAPFVEVWSRINGSQRAGQLAVWKHDHEVVGSLTASRVYAPTMLIQGLATRKPEDSPDAPGKGTISRDLYFYVFHHALHDPSVRYILAYLCLGSARRWHQVLCEAYAHKWPQRAYAYVFALMEAHDLFEGIDPRPGTGEHGLSVDRATGADLRWLSDQAHAESPLLADALDLTPERMHLDQVNGVLAAAGLFRKRVVLTARAGAHRLAMAVVEAGNDHLNPYNLFDSVRLMTAEPRHPDAGRACTALLLEARKLLASMGKTRCVLFARPEDEAAARDAGFGRIDEGLCWVIARKGFASYLSHIFEIIAPD